MLEMWFNRGMKIDTDNLDEIVYGTALLASGGGGDPYIGKLILRQAIEQYGPVRLLDPSRVSDRALVVVVGAIGASTVFLERFPSLDALICAVALIERSAGRKIDALVAAEAGGLNALLPIALGLRLNLPVIDADGMGRAFPEGQMMTYGIYGGSASPMAIVDDHLNLTVVGCDDNRRTEELSRSIVAQMGNSAMGACYPMKGKFFKSACVRNTISLSKEIGGVALAARRAKYNANDALIEFFANRPKDPRCAATLFTGKITDVRRDVGGGFLRGAVKMESHAGDERCEIEFRNENLIAQVNGRVAALVPDIITVLEQDSGAPITTENLRFGQRVTVFAIEAPPLLKTAKALEVIGPRAFGYDHDYRPLNALHVRAA